MIAIWNRSKTFTIPRIFKSEDFYGIISQASNFYSLFVIFFLNIQFFIGKVLQSTGKILQLTSIRVDSLIDHHIQYSPSGL